MKLNIQLFASTNKTTNYELPQFIGTDKPTWLGDFNEAMSDIDAGMHENASDIASMASDVATATATASQASQDVTTLTGTVNTLSSTVTSVQTTANNASQTASSALNTANTANGKADTNATNITTLQGSVATNTSDISNIKDTLDTLDNLTTTEKVVGKFIDGKPLYRQIFTIGNVGTSSTQNLGSIPTLDSVFEIYGATYYNGLWTSLPRVHTSDFNYHVQVYIDNGVLYVHTGGGVIISRGYVIVEYTKTTDSAS